MNEEEIKENVCLEARYNGKICGNKVYKWEMCVRHYYKYIKDNNIAIRTMYPWRGNKDHWRDVYLIL